MTGLARIVACGLAALGLSGSVVYAVDDPDELMPCKVTVVKPGKLAKFVCKPLLLFALPSTPGHVPTAPGAVNTLDVLDTVPPGAGANTYPLAAGIWTGLGNPAGSKGFKYKGTKTAGDPCVVVLIKETVIKGICKGLDVTLVPPIAGTLGIDLTLGTPDPLPALSLQKKYCAEFGGLVVKNVPGLFKAKDAPAPPVCPGPPPVCTGPYTLTNDNFDDNVTDPCIWVASTGGTGPTVAESNERVEEAIPGTSTDDPVTQLFGGEYRSICQLQGDYDIQIDYTLLTWPSSNGVRVALSTEEPQSLVERVSLGLSTVDYPASPREVYVTDFTDGVQGFIATSDLSGKLRQVRNGTALSGYYWNGVAWVLIHSVATTTGNVTVVFGAFSHDPVFTNQTVAVAFDNFVLNQGSAVCPNTSTSTTTSTTTTITTTPCPASGALVGGFCWYLGGPAVSCDDVCTAIGNTCDPATDTYAGAGGTDANCDAVLAALGHPGVSPSPSTCTYGALGCIYAPIPDSGARCINGPTNCGDAGRPEDQYQRACACN